ncbi:hypothetical protein PYW07_003378 [Mythimna separata]|uniref:Uncharacterized protein n=1 Tax=Mythimna separata TaxID=271217 RepID=A0AAD7YJM2_MYTSE|nr:hypothetical protein PYW07_003378 [Mythimna separata]
MFLLKIFAIAVIGIQNAVCLRKVYCDADDAVCLTNSAKERVFPKLLAGIPGVEPSEPLHLTRLKIELPNLKYSLLNATLTGVKDCTVTFLKNPSDTEFQYQPCCPHLTIESEYEVEGKVDAVSVKGKGTLKITYENFNMNITGKQKKVELADCKQHVRILDYTIQLDLKGKSTYDYKNLAFGDSGRCKCTPAVRSRYYDRFEEITRTPIMEAFVKKFMENIRDFHIAVPVEELYYQYV